MINEFLSDVFEKFKDNNGKFRDALRGDVTGLLSLYEATHLRTHGEYILDEALDFTTTQLKTLVTDTSHPLAKQVGHALEYPIHKCFPRVEARRYISIYEEDEARNDTLLEFAKTDFNLVQLMHRQELKEISRWKEYLAEKLSYARDGAVELYFWMTGLYFEPHYSHARIIVTKIVTMISFLDDTYDAYATLEELEKLTDAVRRWNPAALNELPDYMKILYKALLSLFDELNEEMAKQGRSHMVDSARKEMIGLVCAYHQETKWYEEGYMPKFDEYMTNALKSSAIHAILASSFVGMGEIVGKQAVNWLDSYPKILRASETIGRLMDDIVSHEFEQQRGHCPSAVECYMEEYGVGEEEAIEKLSELVDKEWKDINEECLKPTAVSMHVLLRALNLTRAANLVYKKSDGYTMAEVLKDHIRTLYVNQIPI